MERHRFMADSKVLALMILRIFFTVAAEGVHVSIGSMLASTMSVHCLKGHHDEGVWAPKPMKELAFDLSVEFHGPYVRGFDSDGKKTTMLTWCTRDATVTRTYNGCAWVAQIDGFYCNHDFMPTWTCLGELTASSPLKPVGSNPAESYVERHVRGEYGGKMKSLEQSVARKVLLCA